MVVLVIIGITVGMAMLSMDDAGRDRELETESRRLARLLELASEEAILQASTVGMRISAEEYGFLRLDIDRWTPVEGDHIFRQRRMPPGLRLELIVEGLPATLDFNGGESALEPQIYILSSGEFTPFELRVERPDDGRYFLIEGSPTGELSLEGPLGTAL